MRNAQSDLASECANCVFFEAFGKNASNCGCLTCPIHEAFETMDRLIKDCDDIPPIGNRETAAAP